MRSPLPPTIEDRVELALQEITGKQYRRLMLYISEHPDQYTHVIGRECAVGYPPARLWELNNEILPKFGLHIRCHAPEQWLQNRWGETSHVHQWRLELLPKVSLTMSGGQSDGVGVSAYAAALGARSGVDQCSAAASFGKASSSALQAVVAGGDQ